MIFGRKRWCLLDTGSEVSVIPARYVPSNAVKPSTRILNAANGTSIPVSGETNLMLELGDQCLDVPCLVSEHVDEILLGLTFLEENRCVWHFGDRSIQIGGCEYSLFSHKVTWSVRRVTLQDDTTVAPRCQQTVMAQTVYRTLASSTSEWATKPFEVAPGVRLARTMVADSPSNVRMQVVNTNDEEVRLPKGLSLGNLEEVVHIDAKEDNGEQDGDYSHIDSLISGTDESLPTEQRGALEQLLIKYSNVFSKGDHDLGCATAVKHRIDTGSSRPIRQSLRRQPPHYVAEIDRQLEEWQSEGKISPSQSEWASNIVIVRKKDGSLRFCVDYRQLNERTVKDSYPLPRIDDCLDCLGGANWFSTMDLRSGYHQVAMDERDKDKTTFVTRRGTFCFNVMPFGLCNAPATFQRLMDCTMRGLNYEVCLIYLDDIIVFSPDVATHLERLEVVLACLRRANLKLKPNKCSFLHRSVDFLGYKVSGRGIETDERKIDAVIRWPVPTKLREVRGFLGLCGYYRRFVHNFSEVAAPLHALTKKNVPFRWTQACQTAFETLKDQLTTAPILVLPRDEGEYILDTDASDHGIGAVLSQVHDGEEKVVSYASRLYSAAEQHYCVTRKELLAVVFFMKQFRQYLLGRPFRVRTDHAALQWLRRTPEPIGQQSRWLEVLEEFTFQVEHRPGRKHENADALSRRPCRQCGLCAPQTSVTEAVGVRALQLDHHDTVVWSTEAIKCAQERDPDIGPLYKALTNNEEKPLWDTVLGASQETKAYWTQWNLMTCVDGVIYRRYSSPQPPAETLQMLAPSVYRQEIMQQAHKGFTGGHMGERRTLQQVRRRAYWIGWAADTRRFCRRCPECCSYKRGAAPRKGQLQKMTVGMPWERLGVDITGPHPKSRNGYIYMLTVTDYFTKWADAFPIRNQEATTVAKVLVDRVFSYMGMPVQILTDRGSNFESQLFGELLRRLHIDRVRTTAYKPSTNGQVERFHRTLNSILGKVVSENQRDWDTHIPYAVAAYRATIHESTGYSPNFLMFGHEVRAPLDVVMGLPVHGNASGIAVDDFVQTKVDRMRAAYRSVRDNLQKAAERQKQYYDLRVKPASHAPGDLVWLWNARRKQGRTPKWQRCYTGPYKVVEQIGPVNYRIQRSARSKSFVVHVDKLQPYLNDAQTTEPNPGDGEQTAELSDDVSLGARPVEFESRPQRQRRPPVRYRQ